MERPPLSLQVSKFKYFVHDIHVAVLIYLFHPVAGFSLKLLHMDWNKLQTWWEVTGLEDTSMTHNCAA